MDKNNIRKKSGQRKGRQLKFNDNSRLGFPTLRNQARLPPVMPPEWFCFNRYVSQIIGYTSASNSYGAFAYYINSPFTPDVTGTDTSNAIGCAELATLYANTLVLSAKVKIEVCNEEDFEIVFTAAPSTYAIQSLIGSASEALQIAELPWGKSMTLGRNTGMNRESLEIDVNLSKLVGNRAFYHADQNWIGISGAVPTNKLYITFGIAALSGNLLAEGVTFRLSIDYKVRWMNRKYDDITTLSEVSQKGTVKILKPREIEKARSEKTLTSKAVSSVKLS